MLTGKIALVTGASRGIGKNIVELFLKNNAKVIANYRRDPKGLVELEKANPESLVLIKADVSKSDEVKSMFSQLKEKFNRLDILVNNAGILRDSLILMTKEEDFDSIINTNLKGSFLCLQQASKIMMRQNSGRIINISSIVGIEGNAGQCAYSSSKAGVIGLTKSAAKELGAFNIKVNAIAPGLIKTDMTSNLPPEITANFIKNTPLKRIGTPEDIARTALFLASDLSDFITGEIISVDGGLVL